MTGQQVRERPARPSRPDPRQVAIDPRILARLTAVRHDRHRRRGRIAKVMLGVVTLAALAWLVSRSRVLAVNRVNVDGGVRTMPAVVLAAAGLRSGTPMLAVDAAAIDRRVAALPWVASAAVSRQWPRTVTIRITERTPAAQLAGPSGQIAIVDRGGRVLALGPFFAGLPPSEAAALPALEGWPPAGGPGTTVERSAGPALALLPALAAVSTPAPLANTPGPLANTPGPLAPVSPARGGQSTPAGTSSPPARRVSAVTHGPQGDIRAVLSPGPITVVFGTTDGLSAKVAAVRLLLAQVPLGTAATIDVQVVDAPVLTSDKIGTMVSTTQRG